jgi:ATP-dependent DNA helicase RecQ
VRSHRKTPKIRSAAPRELTAAELRALRPSFIPIFGPPARKGPKIIAVRANAPAAPQAAPQIERAHSPGRAAPAAVTTTQPAAPPPSAVRLGRLPPRAALAGGAPSRIAGFEAIAVTPTVPRRAIPKERWSHIDARAERLGAKLGPTAREVARAAFERVSTLCTLGRGRAHELSALAAAVELPQTSLVVGPDARALLDLRERLERAGARTALLNDSKGANPNPAVLDGIANGTTKVVLTTPRWLARDAVLRALGRPGVALALILEAQAVSPSSASFSPAHARLSIHLERLGRPPALAFAPGASPEVRHDIAEALLPAAPHFIDAAPVAANVCVSAERCPRELRRRALSDAVRRLPGPTLVLCASPREADAAYETLRSLGLPTHRYHEEMRAGVRAGEQLEFSTAGDRAVLVATSAFGPGGASDEDPEGVPLRYGRRTAKSDIRSLVRFEPPASLEQLADELSLVGRDGGPAQAVVFHDPTDRPLLEAQTDATRPSGEQILLLARALEGIPTSGGAITTEALALAARSSRRAVETLSELLDGMGVVAHKDGWLTRLAPEPVVLKELRALAERYATVRALDARRLASVLDLLARAGCRTAGLARALGDASAQDCGVCSSCAGGTDGTAAARDLPTRHPPVRRFAVQTLGVTTEAAGTFHADERVAGHSKLTAKLADFR